MDRRQVIKGVVAAAGTFYARPPILALGQDRNSMEESSFALPIRGITNKGGRLVQPIQLTFTHTGKDATLVVRADHQEIERRILSSGTHMRFVRMPATTLQLPAVLRWACHSPLFLRPEGSDPQYR